MTYDSSCRPKPPAPPDICECGEDGCEKVGYQYADICVPIELTPDAVINKVTVECCGEPFVECEERDCKSACELVVVQKVNIKIPIHYKVTACMGESAINCRCEDHCC